MLTTIDGFEAALARAHALAAGAAPGRRVVLGLTGPPGAGKSTMAASLVEAMGPAVAVLVPMDGFHLSDTLLRQLGRWDRKGAPDTFDAAAYVDLLTRLRRPGGRAAIDYAPVFDRSREIAEVGGMLVPPGVPLVVTEGNYLLLDEGPWAAVGDALDECWYVDLDDTTRRARLQRRHESHGRSPAEAAGRTLGSDEANAALVTASRHRAQALVPNRADHGQVSRDTP